MTLLLKTLSGRRASQNEEELTAFIALLNARQTRRYLEIGARHGDTFFDVMRALPPKSLGVALDLPGGLWGKSSSRSSLDNATRTLRASGYNAQAIYGDSKSAAIRQLVMLDGPFDAILIDGDHTYEGVKADWENYRSMAPLIAFHDIVGTGQMEKVHGHPVEVPRLWSELKSQCDHVEFVAAGSAMGIGVIFQ